MKEILAAGDIRLTKSLGQNFLHDGNQLRRIVSTASLTQSDKVLEIGPGLGPLTELLLAEAGEVLAIEKDGRLVEVLKGRFSAQLQQPDRFRLLHDDALDYIRRESRDWGRWKLVSNLPYCVASPILVDLAQSPSPPLHMVATLQLEVARRLMAEPGGDDYGILTLLVQLHYIPQATFRIPAGCFHPEPDVDSACISLIRRDHELLPAELRTAFTEIVKLAFSQRRKMMLKLLRGRWTKEQLEEAFAATGIQLQARAETVRLEQFVELTKVLRQV
jgi:16S rRNA (adenine1518-N6/adenine1519-N6)-dimethyltransferase